jgi:hypothetical protein
MNGRLLLATLAGLLCFCIGCKKDDNDTSPDQPVLTLPVYYFRMNFMNDSINIAYDDTYPNYYKSGSMYMFGNVLRNDSAAFDLDWLLYFPHQISEADILGLKGKNLPTKPNAQGIPYVRLFLQSSAGGLDYTTGFEQVDYGPSTFIVEDVIRHGSFQYYSFTYGMDSLITAPNYVLRGSFDLNVTKNSWNIGVPDTLYPVTGGKFSLRVFVPVVP